MRRRLSAPVVASPLEIRPGKIGLVPQAVFDKVLFHAVHRLRPPENIDHGKAVIGGVHIAHQGGDKERPCVSGVAEGIVLQQRLDVPGRLGKRIKDHLNPAIHRLHGHRPGGVKGLLLLAAAGFFLSRGLLSVGLRCGGGGWLCRSIGFLWLADRFQAC